MVVQDHPFADVAGLAATSEHVPGDLPGGGRPFDLAGRDRFLHQGVDQVAPTSPFIRDRFAEDDLPAGTLVNDVQQP